MPNMIKHNSISSPACAALEMGVALAGVPVPISRRSIAAFAVWPFLCVTWSFAELVQSMRTELRLVLLKTLRACTSRLINVLILRANSLCQVSHAAIAATAFPLPTVPAMFHVNWMSSEGWSLTFFPPKRPPSTNIVCLNYNGQYKDGNTKDLLHGGRVFEKEEK